MALLTTQQIAIGGTAVTLGAANGGGDTVTADERTFLVVNNGGGSPVTVTVAIPGTYYGVAVGDPTISVPAAGTRYIGPLPTQIADPTTGQVGITYSGVTSVTVAAVRV